MARFTPDLRIEHCEQEDGAQCIICSTTPLFKWLRLAASPRRRRLSTSMFATEVWRIDPEGRATEEFATAGIDALEAFIKEIGLPCTLN